MKNFVGHINPFFMFLAAAMLAAFTSLPACAETHDGKTRVLILGASVGKSWDVSGLPDRLKDDRFEFEAVQAWQFDKSEALEEALMRPKRKFKPTRTYLRGFFEPSPVKPDIIIIKECAAYFPGDLASYREQVKKWVATIRAAGKKPAIATVSPITESRTRVHPGRIESIREFNDWVRKYAEEEKLPLLDLEAAMRADEKSRLLKEEYSKDGLHLNRKAYDVLDKVLLDMAVKAVSPGGR